jgi:capsular exopolysaccharide synthesis family protein
LKLPEADRRDPRQVLLEQAKESLKVKAQGQTRIIEILVDSPDPKLAADFANTLASEFIDMNLEARWQMTQRTGEWLSRQLEEMRIKLERSEDRLQAYARQAGLMFTEKQGSVEEDRLRQLQEELSKARAERIARQSRFELAKASPPETLADVLNDASLREYQTKLTDLRREESELSTTYTPEHAKVKRVRAQLETIAAALKSERDAILQRIRNDYEEAVRREKLLELDYERQSRLVSEQSEKAIQYNILKREVDSNRQLYDAMLERVRAASVASALRASNVRVVDAARPPEFPYKPRVALNTALGLLLGGFLGVALILMRERMDRTLQEPGDAQFYLNVAELGVIPSAERPRKLLKGPDADGEPAVETAVAVQKHSVLAESFRAALTSILFSGQNGNRPRVIVLTSPSPGEGKTTVVANLGEALAEVNKRVLLIDGDLRKPRLHEIFETERERGLSDLLRDPAPLAEAVNGSVRETRVANLFLLPSGAESAASTNLLYSERMAALLELMEKEFDTVLIDTPPVMQIPDARILGRLADAVILVLRAGKTSRDAALAVRERLAEDGTRVLGAILNDWDPKRAGGGRYGYGYGYERYRYYRYGE